MRHGFAGFIMVCSVVLLSISIYSLMEMYWQEQKDDAVQEQLKEIYENNEDGAEILQKDAEVPDGATDSLTVDVGLSALHNENPDCIGWITIQGTPVDYPVMYHPGEVDYYLHRDFYGEYSDNGCLFISESCDPKDCDNLIIYGHHMNSGKMFATLEGYKERAFYEEHPLISYHTMQGNEIYQVITAFTTPVYTGKDFPYYSFTRAANRKEYDTFIETVTERSFYDTGIPASYGEKLLTLSTCEYSQENGRMVVVAKKIENRDEKER